MACLSPFAWSSESFYALFIPYLTQGKKLVVVKSSNYFCKEAFLRLKNLYPHLVYLLTPNSKGVISEELLLEVANQGCSVYFIPFLNEDILTSNQHLSNVLQQEAFRDCVIYWDCSYGLALGENLPFGHYFLAWGIPFGLPDFFGWIASAKEESLFSNPVKRGFFSLWSEVLKTRKNLEFSKVGEFLEELRSECGKFFKEDLPTPFFSSELSPKNALAIRFFGIKASELVGSLSLEDISAINGIECHLALSRPSFVLRDMGYSEKIARELLSISIGQIDCKEVAKRVARAYCTMRQINTGGML